MLATIYVPFYGNYATLNAESNYSAVESYEHQRVCIVVEEALTLDELK